MLLFHLSSVTQAFKILFALQQPLHVHLSPVREVARVRRRLELEDKSWEERCLAHWPRRFQVDFFCHVPWTDLPVAREDQISVLSDIVYFDEGLCGSCAQEKPLSQVLAGLPQPRTRSTKAGSQDDAPRARLDAEDELLLQYPWLRGVVQVRCDGTRDARGSEASSSSAHIPEEMGEELAEAVFASLATVRETWASDGDFPDWKVVVLGGSLQIKHKCVSFDAVQAMPRANSRAEQWAVAFGMGKTCRFEISLYGMAVAQTLARAYCHKCQWYFLQHEDAADTKPFFTQADVDAYVEPEAFSELFLSLSGKSRARAQWLRDLHPTLNFVW